MKFGFKVTGLATAALFAGAVVGLSPLPAAASTVSITVIAASGDGSGALANTSDVYAPGYGAFLPSGASWTSVPGAYVVTPPPGSDSGVYRSPWDETPREDLNSYFAVGPNTQPNPVKLSFSSGQSALDILWGSVDSYNTLAFSAIANGADVSITGSDVATAIGGDCGSPANFGCTALLRITINDDNGAATTFGTASFSSGSQAFEFALAPVPLPAAGFLLLGGLGGLVAMRRRKRAA
ncbi:VPLPA-CTERM sorting domain-containing protein [Roseovarius spongiae]|uniref:VPLPA-CTERM sorting domain-containing protein n=1 Tax=Roseovarius spongiae TaxID=2320272 RepID=A0A3A8AQ61_9RHOB|nr:VPLPA-CTERM sorting domain-containing protein [Roseovarius spongiae]RKF12392.1 VPLPA-CTERM sorting domain-containing protein [Roseovarius spongiae]